MCKWNPKRRKEYGTEKIFEEIMTKNFPNPMKDTNRSRVQREKKNQVIS